MNDETTFDPFAVLRAIEHGHGDQAEALFTGSEPVPAEPTEPATPEPAVAASEPTVAAPAPPAAITTTQLESVVRDALLSLEDRIVALEALARRNGWPL